MILHVVFGQIELYANSV